MKQVNMCILLIMTMLISCGTKEKNIEKNYFPVWLEGNWLNSGQSNTNDFEFWVFANDTIVHTIGMPVKSKEILNEKYADYKKITQQSDSTFQINFIKDKDTIAYNFRLEKLEWTTYRAFSYSLIINGKVIYEHNTDAGYILINQKDFLN